MTDAQVASATVAANLVERQARDHWAASVGEEQQAAQAVVRQAVALRRALENWIVQRALTARREATCQESMDLRQSR